MMIQLNLLPDVKKEYIRTKKIKRLLILSSSMTAIIVMVLLIIIFSFVQFAQKKNISDLTKDIDKEVKNVTSITALNDILTIQNQLATIPGLDELRPETSRVFNYLKTVTPVGVYISTIKVDVINSKIEISGTSKNLALINTYADTLKFATYTVKDVNSESTESTEQLQSTKPFMNVLTDLNRNQDKSSYTIKLDYDPVIFNNTKVVVISVPNTITTRSVTGQPNISAEDSLFNAPPNPDERIDQ